MAIGGVKSKETRSYQKGKCNSPIFSTFLGRAKYRTITFSLLIRPCFLAFYTTNCHQILYSTNFLLENVFIYLYALYMYVTSRLGSIDDKWEVHKMA